MLMENIATVTVNPEATNLTTLDRVKSELGISGTDHDEILEAKIAEASADIEAHLGRTLSRVTISETFWGGSGYSAKILLDRYPVVSITSVTVDDVLVDADEYRLDPDTGILYRLDTNGYPCTWTWVKSVVIVYVAGYLLPAEADRNLPYSIEGAAVDLVSSYWQSRGRDSTLRSENIPDVISREYWVGAVGAEGELPPSVVAKIAPFRRAQV